MISYTISQIPNKSLIFAPMEGAVTPHYRKTILDYYPDWDYVFTDFLRLPNGPNFKTEHILRHIGPRITLNDYYFKKTVLQILATEKTSNISSSQLINDLNIPWIDLNFGCPSKHVNRHQGGAYLLDHPHSIKKITHDIRTHYQGLLSAKIRIGVNNTNFFSEIIKTLEGEGVDLIIIHPRTKVEMYRGKSRWEYIMMGQNIVKTPIVGNGDILTASDIDLMFNKTNCHSVMIGRGALSRPWLAKEYNNSEVCNDPHEITKFYNLLLNEMKEAGESEKNLMITIKNLSHYLLKNNNQIREQIVRVNKLSEMFNLINGLDNETNT